MNKYVAVIFATLVLIVPFALAQGPLDLQQIAVVPVAGQGASGVLQPIRCDASSNVYVRTLQGAAPSDQTPVLKISPDGKSVVFHAAPINGQAADIVSFSPEASGGVALLVANTYRTKYEVEILNANGTLEASSALPLGLEPMQIAASPSGEMLVTGLSSQQAGSGTAFVGIFSPSGQIEREVNMANDIPMAGLIDNLRPAGLPARIPSVAGSAAAFEDYRHALQLSSASALDNGGFVFAHLTTGGPVYVITPGSSDAPKEFQPLLPNGSTLSSVKSDGNRIVVTSIEKKSNTNEISDVYITVWNPDTLQETGEFQESNSVLGAALACYGNETFTFLTTGSTEQLQLVTATVSSQ